MSKNHKQPAEECQTCVWTNRCQWRQGAAYDPLGPCEWSPSRFQAGRPMRIRETAADLPHDADKLFCDIT